MKVEYIKHVDGMTLDHAQVMFNEVSRELEKPQSREDNLECLKKRQKYFNDVINEFYEGEI